MSVFAADRDHLASAESAATLPTEEGADKSTPSAGSGLRLRMHYAPPHAPVLSVTGDVDAATTPRLAELLWSRLHSVIPALVLDLSGVGFLGVAGVQLLAAAEHYARYRGIALRLVTQTRAVDRALHAGGLAGTLPRFDTLAAAHAAEPPTAAPGIPTPRSPRREE